MVTTSTTTAAASIIDHDDGGNILLDITSRASSAGGAAEREGYSRNATATQPPHRRSGSSPPRVRGEGNGVDFDGTNNSCGSPPPMLPKNHILKLTQGRPSLDCFYDHSNRTMIESSTTTLITIGEEEWDDVCCRSPTSTSSREERGGDGGVEEFDGTIGNSGSPVSPILLKNQILTLTQGTPSLDTFDCSGRTLRTSSATTTGEDDGTSGSPGSPILSKNHILDTFDCSGRTLRTSIATTTGEDDYDDYDDKKKKNGSGAGGEGGGEGGGVVGAQKWSSNITKSPPSPSTRVNMAGVVSTIGVVDLDVEEDETISKEPAAATSRFEEKKTNAATNKKKKKNDYKSGLSSVSSDDTNKDGSRKMKPGAVAYDKDTFVAAAWSAAAAVRSKSKTTSTTTTKPGAAPAEAVTASSSSSASNTIETTLLSPPGRLTKPPSRVDSVASQPGAVAVDYYEGGEERDDEGEKGNLKNVGGASLKPGAQAIKGMEGGGSSRELWIST